MSPGFYIDIPGMGYQNQVWQGSSHSRGGYHHQNSGFEHNRYESHEYESEHYRGRMDKATQNWLIGGMITQGLAGLIAPNDPDTARMLGTFGQIATGVGVIRDSGRERYDYHRERHVYNENQNVWNQNSWGHWDNGSSYRVQESYGWQNNPWICW